MNKAESRPPYMKPYEDPRIKRDLARSESFSNLMDGLAALGAEVWGPWIFLLVWGERHGEKAVVKFELAPVGKSDPMGIHLHFIGVDEEQRGCGWGTRAMTSLLAVADFHEINLRLTIDPSFGVGKRVLRKFYEKFGFVSEKPLSCGEMYRHKSSTHTEETV